jgi:hypothetical protein
MQIFFSFLLLSKATFLSSELLSSYYSLNLEKPFASAFNILYVCLEACKEKPVVQLIRGYFV